MFENNGIFQKKITLESCDFSFDNQWNLPQVLTRFQEVASYHVDSHDIGIHDLIKKDLMWVVLQTKFEICDTGKPGDAVWLKTWFLPPRHKVAQREYQITDLEDRVLVRGTSRWIVMNAETRQVDSRLNEVLSGKDSCLNKNFEKRMTLLRNFEVEGDGIEIIPEETAIDFNGHVNNARYLEYMCMALKEEIDRCSIIQIDYHKELRCGESLRIFKQKTETDIKVKGLNSEGELVFIGSAAEILQNKEEMTTGEKARLYHVPGTNCAQCVLKACRDYTGITDEIAMAAAEGFGSGVRCGEICGAITGGVMALGLAGSKKSIKISREAAAKLVETFRDNYGCVRCEELKAKKISCNDLIEFGGNAAEAAIQKIKNVE